MSAEVETGSIGLSSGSVGPQLSSAWRRNSAPAQRQGAAMLEEHVTAAGSGKGAFKIKLNG